MQNVLINLWYTVMWFPVFNVPLIKVLQLFSPSYIQPMYFLLAVLVYKKMNQDIQQVLFYQLINALNQVFLLQLQVSRDIVLFMLYYYLGIIINHYHHKFSIIIGWAVLSSPSLAGPFEHQNYGISSSFSSCSCVKTFIWFIDHPWSHSPTGVRFRTCFHTLNLGWNFFITFFDASMDIWLQILHLTPTFQYLPSLCLLLL